MKKLVYVFSQQLLAHGVLPCYKHFPGIGGTNDNSHFGYATVNRTLEQFEAAGLAVIMILKIRRTGKRDV